MLSRAGLQQGSKPLATPRQNQDEVTTCSNQTLEGVYGLPHGTRPAQRAKRYDEYVPGTIEKVIGARIHGPFDGTGTSRQISKRRRVPSAAF